MELHETEERRALRKAVSEIAKDFGHDYYVAKSLGGEKSSELWHAVGGNRGSSGSTSPRSTAAVAAASTTCRSSVRNWPRPAARC